MPDHHIEAMGLVWALGPCCALEGRPFDAELLLQQSPLPHTPASLLRGARHPGDPHQAPGATRFGARQGDGAGRIEIERLAFRHGDNRPWLFEGLDLTLEPGQAVAVMGPSGCGKSTLAKLLQSFWQPQAGQIRIDGIDSRHLGANALRAHFGVVPQEAALSITHALPRGLRVDEVIALGRQGARALHAVAPAAEAAQPQ